jgi:uncharacterized protein DUF4328
MPCVTCGDIIPDEVARCPACGAWTRRRDFRALGIGVFMLLGFNAFMALGSGISLIHLLTPLNSTAPDNYDPVATTRTMAPYADIFVISGVLAVLTGLLFVAWLWKAYGQASGPRSYGRAWTILGWLCPIANLWIPPRVVHEIWVGSGRFPMAERHRIGLLVTGWWCSLLGSLGLMELFSSAGAQSLDSARFTLHMGIAAASLLALSATLCMAIVFQVTRLQIRH